MVLVGVLSTVPGCGCRMVLIAGATCSLATNIISRLGTTLLSQQLAEFTVAPAFCSRIAVMGLVFKVVPADQFQAGVFMVHASLLLSNTLSSLIAEVLRDHAGFSISQLLEVSIGTQALALLCALSLPSQQIGIEKRSADVTSSIASVNSRCSSNSAWLDRLLRLRDPLEDLLLSLKNPVVLWWTVWALVMNPAHTIMALNWQSLIRTRGFGRDYNGYALASTYLFAGILTAASRRASPLRSITSVGVICSMLGAALMISQVVASVWELQLYAWLLAYQCVFHLGTAVGIFLIGSELTQAVRESSARDRCKPVAPRVARLTLLFSATGFFGSVNENLILMFISQFSSIEVRLYHLCAVVGVIALLLAFAWVAETLWSRARQAQIASVGGDSNAASSPLLSVL